MKILAHDILADMLSDTKRITSRAFGNEGSDGINVK